MRRLFDNELHPSVGLVMHAGNNRAQFQKLMKGFEDAMTGMERGLHGANEKIAGHEVRVIRHERFSGAVVLGMVGALEPIAGRLSTTLFFFGTLSAGLSSVFPCLLIAPLLIEDYRSGKLDTTSKQFRIITGIASLLALTIPILGFNPIKGQLLTQVFNVFVLLLVVIGIIIVINKKELMGEHKAGYLLNALLGLAFMFSVLISYNGVLAIRTQLG